MEPMGYSEVSEKSLTFGVLMPPWETRSYIRFHLGADIPLQRVKDMMFLFQKVVPISQ